MRACRFIDICKLRGLKFEPWQLKKKMIVMGDISEIFVTTLNYFTLFPGRNWCYRRGKFKTKLLSEFTFWEISLYEFCNIYVIFAWSLLKPVEGADVSSIYEYICKLSTFVLFGKSQAWQYRLCLMDGILNNIES